MAAMLKDHPQMQIYFSITFKTNYLLCVQCIYTAVLNERLNQLKGFILWLEKCCDLTRYIICPADGNVDPYSVLN